ncbi:tail fiber protein [Escherichia coli]|uniref:phage tail fiber protein n=1 Tax=Escherichia coli TaxID=562 RepID=UPI0004D8C4B8|nr:phage tail fiber repeat family protein [Escherichia coli 5-366-08_S3_C2]
MALEDASTTKKGIVQLSSATNSTSETLAATPKAVKSAYDNAEKRLQKDQNGADIPDKGRFLNNINAVSKTDFADKRGMRYVRVNAPAGATSGKYYPVVVMRSAGSVSELASRVIITTATRTAGDPMNNCEFNGFVMPGGWTDRGRYAYGMFWQYQNNERAIHSIMMSNKGDDLRSVFYVDGAAFPVFAFIEDGLSISAPGADLVVNDTTYKFGATNPAIECIAADVILDFKSGRGFYESHSLIVNDNLSCKKLFATDEIVARGGNQIRMIGGEYGALWRNDGAKTYLLLTNQGDVYGGWNTLRPFAIDNATGELVIGTKLSASLNGNALTATKLQTPRRVSGVEFDGSKDITLTAAHVAAFARRATDTYADADGGVPWNAESGAYNVTRAGASYILANFYTGVGSCRTLQIKAHYKNGGLFYRSSRDGYGFESGWEQVYTTGFMPQPADINAPTAAAGWLNSGNGTAFTTAQFITWLNNQGAFSNKYWIARCSWAYANNNYIDDTGCGRIDLSGSVIEVFSNKATSHYTIRVTTTTTSGHGGVNNAEFIYVYNGSDYAPGWRRSYNTRNKPTASDVGALPLSGGTLSGGVTSSGEIVSKYANGFRIAYGNYGFFIRNDGANTYFLLTASGDTLGSWNGLRPITINNTSGAVSIGNGLNVTGGVNGSLNGNASTATKLQTARNINGVKFDGSGDININTLVSRGRVTALSGSTQGTAGIQMYEAYNNSYPTTYGNVLHMKGASAAGEGELLIGWSGTSGAHAPVFIRSRRDNTGAAWSAWAQVYTAKDSIPGVNTTGNQNTTGNAATATKLQTARKIAGVAFDGSADITLTAANLNAYTKTEVANLLSSYASRSSLTGYSGNLDIVAETLVVKSGGSGGFAIWDIGTTTSGANMYIDPNPGINTVWRSTSSRRYKKDIETLQDRYADELLSLRPVWYRSICRGDRKDWGYYGLIAEEVGEIAPQYVHWREPTNNDSPEDISSNGMVAEGVMYERLVVPLIHHIQQLTKRVEELETKLNSPKE